MRDLINEMRRTVVFLGTYDNNEVRFYATGFLIQIDKIFYLLTAKHVILNSVTGERLDKNMAIFFNSKISGFGLKYDNNKILAEIGNGKISYRNLSEIKDRYNLDWVFHENSAVDIALIPFGLDSVNDDVKVVPKDFFLKSDELTELSDTFFMGYQPGVPNNQRITPVIRAGVISRVNEDKTLYIDFQAFPGNSGSPVFLKPSPIKFNQSGISLGPDPSGGKFIGIIGEYVPYQDVAYSSQTNRPRIVFEENTGLSRIWTVDYIEDIVSSNAFHSQLAKVKGEVNGQ